MKARILSLSQDLRGVDINIRLAQHRSTSPGTRLEFLVYCIASDCKITEKSILRRFSGKRKYINHEWIYDVKKEHIISSAMTQLDFLGANYTIEKDIDEYNDEKN